MLSRTAAPNWSGPPDGSWPSSKTIVIRSTTAFMGIPAARSVAAPQVRRVQPVVLTTWTVGGGELHPIKTNPGPVGVVKLTLNRGAPAPQCEPKGDPLPPSFLMS